MRTKTSDFLSIFVLFGIVLTLLALVGAPLVLTAFFKASEFGPAGEHTVFYLSAGLYACALPYVAALFELRGICRLLAGENALSPMVAKGFTRIALWAFALGGVFAGVVLLAWLRFGAYLYALTVIPLFVVPFVCATAGLLALVMAGVFRRAADIKAENDLTF